MCVFFNVLSQFVSIEPLVLHTRHNVSIVSLYVFTVVGLLLPVCFIWLWVHVTSVCSYFTPPWIRVVSVVVKCFTTQDVLTHLLFMLYIQHLYCHTQSDDTAVFYGSAYPASKENFHTQAGGAGNLPALHSWAVVTESLYFFIIHTVSFWTSKVFVTFFTDLHWIWWEHKIKTKQLITF